jgi:HlyD family secretion protein
LNSSRKSRKRLWIILAVVVAVIITVGVVAARALNTPDKLDPSQLGKAEIGDIARSVVATGKVWPITQVEVKSKASGIVTKLDTKVGLSNGSRTEINSGLRPGDIVILQQTS